MIVSLMTIWDIMEKNQLAHTYSRKEGIDREESETDSSQSYPVSMSVLSHQARLQLNKHSDIIDTFASHDILACDGTSVSHRNSHRRMIR